MSWNEADVERFKTLYEGPKSRQEILAAFPGHAWEKLRHRAKRAGFRRGVRPNGEAVVTIEPKLLITEQVAFERRISSLRSEIGMVKEKNRLLMKSVNAADRIYDYARMAIDKLPSVKPPKQFEIKPHKMSPKTKETAVLAMACLHLGEVVDKNQMAGLNAYNFDIAVRRIQVLVERTIKFTSRNMSSHEFEGIHVFLLGDFVSGLIHKELETTNDLTIIEQAHLGALVMSQALLDLAREFPKVEVTCVIGNHGRVTPEKYFKNKAAVSWDAIAYNTMAMLLKNQPNIKFNIPLSFFACVQIYGYKFLLQHGDGIKSNGGLPFYGLIRDGARWREVFSSNGDNFHYYIAAHFHTSAALQTSNGEMMLVGSCKGACDYALGLHLFNKPSQTLFGVHPDHGKTWSLNIDPSIGQDDISVRYRYDQSKSLSEQLL